MKEIFVKQWFLIMIGAFFLSSCSFNDSADSLIQADLFSAFDFADGAQGWTGHFSDYPEGYEDSLELEFIYDDFPLESNLTGKTIRISGKNPHRDLFYFIKRKVDGLKPETSYLLEYDIHFLLSIMDGKSDFTGDVYVKAGGLGLEPELELSEANAGLDQKSQELNMDIGSKPSISGQDVISIGRVEMPQQEESKLFNATSFGQQFIISANDKGEIWLIIGFDSSVSAHLAFYFSHINVFYTEI